MGNEEEGFQPDEEMLPPEDDCRPWMEEIGAEVEQATESTSNPSRKQCGRPPAGAAMAKSVARLRRTKGSRPETLCPCYKTMACTRLPIFQPCGQLKARLALPMQASK